MDILNDAGVISKKTFEKLSHIQTLYRSMLDWVHAGAQLSGTPHGSTSVPEEILKKAHLFCVTLQPLMTFVFTGYETIGDLTISKSNLINISPPVLESYLKHNNTLEKVEALAKVTQEMHEALLPLSFLQQNSDITEKSFITFVKSLHEDWLYNFHLSNKFKSISKLYGTISSSLISLFSLHNLNSVLSNILNDKGASLQDSQHGHEVANRLFLDTLLNTSKECAHTDSVLLKLLYYMESVRILSRYMFDESVDFIKEVFRKIRYLYCNNRAGVAQSLHKASLSIVQLHNLITNYFSVAPFLVERWIIKLCNTNKLSDPSNTATCHTIDNILNEPSQYEDGLPIGKVVSILLQSMGMLLPDMISEFKEMKSKFIDANLVDHDDPTWIIGDICDPFFNLSVSTFAEFGELVEVLLSICAEGDKDLSMEKLLGGEGALTPQTAFS